MRHKYTNWRKSTRSGGNDNCVEVAFADEGSVGVRDSKNRKGSVLEFDSPTWQAFIDGVWGGEFDLR